MLYDNLWLCSLNEELHRETCGYWYTVTSNMTPHTAFRTRAALLRWLERRGLTLTAELPPHGQHGHQKIAGAYRRKSHLNPADMPRNSAEPPFLVMDNGRYTEGVVTVDADCLRTVHVVNCNAPRPVFDYSLARAHEDAGLPGLPGAWSPMADAMQEAGA